MMLKKEEPRYFSFMANDFAPYASLLIKLRASQKNTSINMNETTPSCLTSSISQSSDSYEIGTDENNKNHSELSTCLLNMVRSRSREAEDEVRDHPIILPPEDPTNETNIYDGYVHGLNIRMTDRSVSRSRVSRMSTRRDMDIPSILAFTATVPDAVHLEIPAFQNIKLHREEKPRWSIRRSVCPVCSQKWKDKSSIKMIKSSGLKRNTSYVPPSVIAPGRLRTSLAMGYGSRHISDMMDRDISVTRGSLRNTSATWQLTRARRFRIPRPILPSPEDTAPPKCNAPLAQRDLDTRISRFLSDTIKIK